MLTYLVRRLCLIPMTLFAIILINFVILNLAPGDPSTLSHIGATGEAERISSDASAISENQFLLFREHYGLTLPVLWNTWPLLSELEVKKGLEKIDTGQQEMSVQEYHKLRMLWGNRARFVMPFLLKEASNSLNPYSLRLLAANFFIRGGTRQGFVGAILTPQQRAYNLMISESNLTLNRLRIQESDSQDTLNKKIEQLEIWFHNEENASLFIQKGGWSVVKTVLFETRFCRYMARVLTLNFGTLRNDNNKSVISEVGKRLKYSLTLAVVPLFITFFFSLSFGLLMAVKQNTWIDYVLNIALLILFAIPIYIVVPFLIEKVALHKTLPFTAISIPYSGFHSPLEIYDNFTSPQRLADISLHLLLPLIAIIYGSFAVQARLARTAFLEVLRQDYIRTAKAKGLPAWSIFVRHVGRNGAVTLVTSLAASLGVVLGGSLIVETLFEINGFGRFFYDAIINRDYNVVLFSAFAGSLLTLVGYLAADIAYTLLDPRISLE